MLYVIKVILAAIIIVVVTEVSKATPFIGALIKSLPIISIVSLTWLYLDTRDVALVASLSRSTFWLVLPTLPMFLALPWLLSLGVNYFVTLAVTVAGTGVLYFASIALYKALGIQFS